MRFRILGTGNFGKALSKIFHNNMLIEDSFAQIAPLLKDDILIPAVPSNAVVEVLEKALTTKPKAIMLVSKGLAAPELLSKQVEKFDLPIIFFAGPNFAQEIEFSTEFLSVTLAGPEEFTRKIDEFLSEVICDKTTDLILPQVSSIVKNVTAFVIGYLNPTENARATLIMQGIKEAATVAKTLGSTEQNFQRACISDFILTCVSEKSRNFRAGQEYRAAQQTNNTSNESDFTKESLNSVRNLHALKGDSITPIIDFFYNLIHNKQEDLSILKNQLLHKSKPL